MTGKSETHPANDGDRLADEIRQQVEQSTGSVLRAVAAKRQSAAELTEYQHLTHTETWTERWPDGERTVTAEVWGAAANTALAAHDWLVIPARDEPYYFERPMVLRSGQCLSADPTAELRLRPGVGTCLVRNANLTGFADGPVPDDLVPDTGIVIEGGLWSTLCTSPREPNGNALGRPDVDFDVTGCHGVILLQNVRQSVVRDLTIKQSKPFGIHLGLASEVLVDNIRFVRHYRDGVHLGPPSHDIVIRNIRGETHDDLVALNAWDWVNSNPAFGPLHHILVEGVHGAPWELGANNAIRLLPGVKRFSDGSTVDCPITDCVLCDLETLRELKCYDQPNLELGRDRDFSLEVGRVERIWLQRLRLPHPVPLELGAMATDVTMEDVQLGFEPTGDDCLVRVGPLSMTYKHGSDDPSKWVEVFSPDRDVTVRRLTVRNVSTPSGPVADPMGTLVQVGDQQLNPDYPRTTPKGGTGRAYLLP